MVTPRSSTAGADLVLRKGYNPDIDSYSAFFENDHRTPTGLHGYLNERGIDTLIMAGYQQPVRRCLDTIAGAQGSLDDHAAFTALADSDAAVVVAAANDVDDWEGMKPRAKLLREMERLQLAIDEAGDVMMLELTVTAKQEEKAQQMQQVVQGLIALYGLGQDQVLDPHLGALLQSLEVTRDAAEVRVSTSFPTATLLQALSEQIGVPAE